MILDEPWWQRRPDWLRTETDALDQAGLRWERDEEAFTKGTARLNVWVEGLDGEETPLVVTFPDLYPYFRFDVQAPTLSLRRHQHPMGKNLCLLSRGTEHWNSQYTVTELLREQFPRLIEAATSDDLSVVADLEEKQPEPFTEYYPYHPSMILVGKDWEIPQDQDHGTMVIGTLHAPYFSAEGMLQGAVLAIHGSEGEILAEASQSIEQAYSGPKVDGVWTRVPERVSEFNPGQFISRLVQEHPFMASAPARKLHGDWIKVWGVLLPDEVDYHTMGEGWVFACAFGDRHHLEKAVTTPGNNTLNRLVSRRKKRR